MATDFLQERRQRIEQYRKQIRQKVVTLQKIDIPDGLFIKCEGCGASLYQEDVTRNMEVCPLCDFHFRMGANERLAITIDELSFQELDPFLESQNPLNMPDYEKKLAQGFHDTKFFDAFVGGRALIGGQPVAIGVLNSFFMMGSMGSVVGERITRLIEEAIRQRLPLILFSASGGARMQEGLYSLMQMAKTSAALARLDQQGLLYLSILTHPTTGGVAASFASLGDINIAEQGALIGFAGARVIKQTIQQELPEGFQTAEFQRDHGQLDIVVHRRQLRPLLIRLLQLHQGGQ